MRPHPVIGFTLDFETTPTYSKMPWYAIRENYCGSVARFGAVPVALPHEVALMEHYLDMIHGLIVTGGAFDIHPSLYGEECVHETVTTKDRRTQFEFAVTRGAIARKIPVLGICGGQQLLNVVLGGTLIQHIPDTIPGALAHEQPNPRTEPGHGVNIKAGTLLANILDASAIQVNSAHHQAVAQPAPDAIVNAFASDGVIEGIELSQKLHPFCLGVQWHPEYHVTHADTRIFEAFVQACRGEYGISRTETDRP